MFDYKSAEKKKNGSYSIFPKKVLDIAKGIEMEDERIIDSLP